MCSKYYNVWVYTTCATSTCFWESSVAYSEPRMELFVKSSILDVWMNSEYASVLIADLISIGHTQSRASTLSN